MAKPTVYSTYPDINPAQVLRLIGTRRALSPSSHVGRKPPTQGEITHPASPRSASPCTPAGIPANHSRLGEGVVLDGHGDLRVPLRALEHDEALGGVFTARETDVGPGAAPMLMPLTRAPLSIHKSPLGVNTRSL